jgi:hypothetical protein
MDFFGEGGARGAHKTPSYDTKMPLKVVFDKTAFVKTHFKQQKILRKIHTSLWIFKISGKKSTNQKSRDFYQSWKTMP